MSILGIVGLAGSGKDTVAQLITSRRMVFFSDVPTCLYDMGLEHPFNGVLRVKSDHLAFADPIKVSAMQWYEFTTLQLWGPSEHRNAPDKRYPRIHPLHKGVFMDKDFECCERCGIVRSGTAIKDRSQWTGPCHDFLSPREALQFIGTEVGRTLWPNTWAHMGVRRAKDRATGGRLSILSDTRFPNEVDLIQKAGGAIWRVERPGSGLKGERATHESERYASTLEVDRVITNDGSLEDLAEIIRDALAEDRL